MRGPASSSQKHARYLQTVNVLLVYHLFTPWAVRLHAMNARITSTRIKKELQIASTAMQARFPQATKNHVILVVLAILVTLVILTVKNVLLVCTRRLRDSWAS
jgi:hypothetical protein